MYKYFFAFLLLFLMCAENPVKLAEKKDLTFEDSLAFYYPVQDTYMYAYPLDNAIIYTERNNRIDIVFNGGLWNIRWGWPPDSIIDSVCVSLFDSDKGNIDFDMYGWFNNTVSISPKNKTLTNIFFELKLIAK